MNTWGVRRGGEDVVSLGFTKTADRDRGLLTQRHRGPLSRAAPCRGTGPYSGTRGSGLRHPTFGVHGALHLARHGPAHSKGEKGNQA